MSDLPSRVAAVSGTANHRVSVVAEAAAAEQVAAASAWHIDPDRRPQGRRTTQLALYEPSLEVLEQMLAANGDAAIKLAPGSAPPEAWQARAECEWISRAGECKQLVLWFGALTTDVGTRRATLLAADGTPHSITGAPDDLAHPDAYEQVAADFGRYLFEPDAAVLAAHLTESAARRFSIAPLHVGSAISPAISRSSIRSSRHSRLSRPCRSMYANCAHGSMGFLGAGFVVLLYATVILSGYRLASVARDGFASLVAVGVITALFFHILVNMLMTVGWAPVTGVPLPFLAYGGTALIVNCVQIGLLQNVALRRREY